MLLAILQVTQAKQSPLACLPSIVTEQKLGDPTADKGYTILFIGIQSAKDKDKVTFFWPGQ